MKLSLSICLPHCLVLLENLISLPPIKTLSLSLSSISSIQAFIFTGNVLLCFYTLMCVLCYINSTGRGKEQKSQLAVFHWVLRASEIEKQTTKWAYSCFLALQREIDWRSEKRVLKYSDSFFESEVFVFWVVLSDVKKARNISVLGAVWSRSFNNERWEFQEKQGFFPPTLLCLKMNSLLGMRYKFDYVV